MYVRSMPTLYITTNLQLKSSIILTSPSPRMRCCAVWKKLLPPSS